MHRETLAIDNLATWAYLNNIELNGVKISSLVDDRGSAVMLTTERPQEDALLMTIPQELVLSLDNVWIYAKSDKHLLQALEAVGEFARTARGAILTFLLLQMTHGATKGEIGTSNPFSEYVKFLPIRIPLPIFWNDEERLLVTGTSLEAALKSKLESLDHEFTLLREKTSSLKWCQQHWWNEDTGVLTFDDWKKVDAMYRSRALDLPGTGHAMVPCMDMANHASGHDTTAFYETGADGDAILFLRDGKHMSRNDEVTITYGDEKGACEMLFSYGFIDSTTTCAREIFLDLEIPDDDPLKLAKKAVSKSPTRFRLFLDGESIGWEGAFVWLIVVNEEDGLEFRMLQDDLGYKELQASWKGKVGADMSKLEALIEHETLRDVFHLRAVTTLQNRIEQQLLRLEGNKTRIAENLERKTIGNDVRDRALKLREVEETLMLHAYESFESQVKERFPSYDAPPRSS